MTSHHAESRIKQGRRERAGHSRNNARLNAQANAQRIAMLNRYKPEMQALRVAMKERQAFNADGELFPYNVRMDREAHGPANSVSWTFHITVQLINGETIRFANTLDGCLATNDGEIEGWIAAWYADDGECQMFTDPGSAYATIVDCLDHLV